MWVLDVVKGEQCNAINTVRIVGVGTNRTLGRHDHQGYSFGDAEVVDKYQLPLGRLAGLKCVVWMYYGHLEVEREGYPEDAISSIVRQWGGPADVEVRYQLYC